MKRLLGVLLAVFLCSNVFAQGINFEHGTFAEAIAKAKKENKMVFMDCYTTWCGPCRMLSKNIFTQKEVGDYFNDHFVSVKMDMEKGEGVALRNKYAVKAYPTLLFMDVAGKVVHTKVGGGDATGLIQEAKVAGDPSKQIGTLEKRFEEGDRDVEFILQYIIALRTAYKKEEIIRVGKGFIASCPKNKLATVDAFTVIDHSKALEFGSEAYRYIITNKAKFVAIEGIGQEKYNEVVSTTVNRYVSEIATTRSMEELTSAIAEAKKDFIYPQQQKIENNWYSTYYLAHKEFGNWYNKQLTVAKSILKTDKIKGGSMIINFTYRVAVDPIFEGVGIYGKAIAEVENLFKNDNEIVGGYFCLACLYKKQNNKKMALENINIYLSKNAGEEEKSLARANRLKEEIERM